MYQPQTTKGTVKTFFRVAGILSVFFMMIICTVAGFAYTFNQPSRDFPVGQPIVIAEGMTVKDIAQTLAEQEVVKLESFFYVLLATLYEPSQIKASTYQFDTPITALEVAARLTRGEYTADLVRLTHFEGERVDQLAEQAAALLTDFDANEFVVLATPHEGKLYPETYFLPEKYTAEELVDLLLRTYSDKTEPLETAIAEYPLSELEVLTLASIIEREANSPESMQMVSGILQNRLAINMALQADASIEYVLDTPLGELPPGQLAIELRELESPYNTYLNVGLPPTPIGNPGLDAIVAVLNPTPSRYLFYITSNDGDFYYAETLQEHNTNISRYLR